MSNQVDVSVISDLLNRLLPTVRDRYTCDNKCNLGDIDQIYSGRISDVWLGTFNCAEKQIKVALKVNKHIKTSTSRNLVDLTLKEYKALEHVSSLLDQHAEYTKLEPIALFQDDCAFAVNFIEGSNLRDIIGNIRLWRSSNFRTAKLMINLCGSWLAMFQRSSLSSEPVHLSKNEIEKYDIELVASKAKSAGLDSQLLSKAVDVANKLKSRFMKRSVVSVHGDFLPWNILGTRNNIAVIDFRHYHLGNAYEDLSLMYEQLIANSRPWRRKGNLEELRQELLVGYQSTLETCSWLFWRIRSLLYLRGMLRPSRSGKFLQRLSAEYSYKNYESELKQILIEAEDIIL